MTQTLGARGIVSSWKVLVVEPLNLRFVWKLVFGICILQA